MIKKIPPFDFHEIVRISSKEGNLHQIYGMKEVIRGKAVEEDQEWYYTIYVIEQDRCWCATESALESTGEFVIPDDKP